jgi:hypothetical protein
MAVEECLMDAVLHQLAARHPGGRGSHRPSGPEASGRCDGARFSRAAVLDARNQCRGARSPWPARHATPVRTSRIRSELRA